MDDCPNFSSADTARIRSLLPNCDLELIDVLELKLLKKILFVSVVKFVLFSMFRIVYLADNVDYKT